MSAQDVTRTYDCKQPGCTNEATSPVGRYSYCKEHQARAKPSVPPPSDSLVSKLDHLKTLARQVDKEREKARKLTEAALAAKKKADDLAEEFQFVTRDLMGGTA